MNLHDCHSNKKSKKGTISRLCHRTRGIDGDQRECTKQRDQKQVIEATRRKIITAELCGIHGFLLSLSFNQKIDWKEGTEKNQRLRNKHC